MNYSFIDERLDFYIIGSVKNKSLSDFRVLKKHNLISGNIYRGKIIKKLKNKNASFIDIGLNKNAYLESNNLINYSEGQDIIVQVIKDEIGNKGAKLTDRFELKSKNIVLSTDFKGLKFSKSIISDDFKNKFNNYKDKEYGLLFRTSSINESYEELEKEVLDLEEIYFNLEKEKNFKPTPKLLYKYNILDDIIKNSNDEIITNSENLYSEYKDEFYIKYDKNFDIEKTDVIFDIKKIFSREIKLKNNAELVFDKTEALTIVDLNSKGFNEFGKDLNIEILRELFIQIKFRNIHGIILVDLITYNKDQKNNHKKLIDETRAMAKLMDSKLNIIDITKLELLEMTRTADPNFIILSEYSYKEIFIPNK